MSIVQRDYPLRLTEQTAAAQAIEVRSYFLNGTLIGQWGWPEASAGSKKFISPAKMGTFSQFSAGGSGQFQSGLYAQFGL